MDEAEFEMLAADLPGLTRVGRFVRSLDAIPWFANLGEPLTPGARAAARAYAEGLGFPEAEPAVLVDWEDAAAAAENTDWNSPAWEAEELLRADVTTRAQEVLSAEALEFAITAAADMVAEPARACAEEAASLWDVEDEAAQRLAVGSAVQAAHQALLALVAADGLAEGSVEGRDFDAADHPFTAKFRLFEFGRWPAALVGRTLNIF